jgi:uncharacterized membrane protein YphA (DoxX/SURF4 family)
MFEKKILNVYTVIIGIFFLVSGVGKLADTAGFSKLISEYGFSHLMMLAPAIVLVEILLGLLLVLLINPKRYAWLSFILLVFFTVAFGYAHFKNGVNNCGCFGSIRQMSMPPAFTFIRNFILIAMALVVWLKYPDEITESGKWKRGIIAVVFGVAIFFAGFTFRAAPLFSAKSENHKFQDKSVKNTALAKYIRTESGKRYLFFCFSYTCPYCWNSIENLRQFKKTNTVDSLVVLAVGQPKDKLVFENNFKPDFAIRDLTGKEMDELTLSYPTGFYIANDTVKAVIQSELPSPFIFLRMNFFSNHK